MHSRVRGRAGPRGPGYANLDAALVKRIRVNDRFAAELRVDAFNVTNTPHFGNPDGYVGDGSDFMTITGTTNLAREGIDERQFRFGLKLSF